MESNSGVYISFDGRSSEDRLGAHCLHIIICIIIAHNLNMGIYFGEQYRYFSDTIFMKTLFKYISIWNDKHIQRYKKPLGKIITNYDKNCNYSLYYIATILSKSDILTYYKKYIEETMLEIFNDYENELKYKLLNKDAINFVENTKSICVHLRLDDLQDCTFDYDSKIVNSFFNDKVFSELNNENSTSITRLFYKYIINKFGARECNCIARKYKSKTPITCFSGQSIADKNKIEPIIDNNFPENDLIVITSPSGDIDLDKQYLRISSNPETDLYILCKTTNLLLSRSTYALVCLFFNPNIKSAWIHEWGVSLAMGLNTQYDKTCFNYY